MSENESDRLVKEFVNGLIERYARSSDADPAEEIQLEEITADLKRNIEQAILATSATHGQQFLVPIGPGAILICDMPNKRHRFSGNVAKHCKHCNRDYCARHGFQYCPKCNNPM